MKASAIFKAFEQWAYSEEAHEVVPVGRTIRKLRELLGLEKDLESESEVFDECRGRVVIDVGGRILFDNVHVGWLKKDAGTRELKDFADAMSAEYPLWTGDFLSISEPKVEE
jgi:hypothetical protein